MSFDVLVAGAGPAGLSAAFAAAKGGARVAVFERSKEIGYPIHTSGGSWIDELRKLDIPQRFMSPVRQGVFVSPHERATFTYDEPLSCVLDVRGLYQYLAELASQAGAVIFVDSPVTQPFMNGGELAGLRVHQFGHQVTFEARLVIDASGAAGFVARRLGLTSGVRRVGVGAEYDLYAPDWPAGKVALLFGSHIAPKGYGWVFPHTNRRVRVGIGLIRPDTKKSPRHYLETLLAKRTLFSDELARISRLELHTGIIPSEGCVQPTVANHFMITGDAGGLVSTLLGEGIRFAISIGRMAGEVAAEAVREERYDVQFLRKYERSWKKRYGRMFQIGALLNDRLASYSDDQWDEKIRALARMEPVLVARILKGDFTYKLLLDLIKTRTHLVSRTFSSGLKSLLKNA
ncbi:MAG: NAD(P)/FAD-dependent oxidoreductase [bacterium]